MEKERERETGRKREKECFARAAKDNEKARRGTREVGPRSLINETYAAAADTEMHCKYSAPQKKTIVAGRDLYLSKLRPRVEASNFFSSVEQFVGRAFFASMFAR